MVRAGLTCKMCIRDSLDITSGEWLEDFLRAYSGAFIVISHDRYFLDRITNRTFEMENHKLTLYKGNYTNYLRQKEEDNLAVQRKYENTTKEIHRLEGIVAQQRQWNREKNIKTAESKLKMIERLESTLEQMCIRDRYDTVLLLPVEVREFFPQSLCERTDGEADIRILPGNEVAFNEYLADFLSYARDIAHVRELSTSVQIYDIFEENHTAYTVSDWHDSIPLRYYVERSGGNLNWNAARQLFMPVLSALSTMHTCLLYTSTSCVKFSSSSKDNNVLALPALFIA